MSIRREDSPPDRQRDSDSDQADETRLAQPKASAAGFRRRLSGFIGVACCLGALILVVRLIWNDPPAGNQPVPAPDMTAAPPNRPVELPTGDYVGSAACQGCHPNQHGTWSDSYHRRMTQAATEESVLGDFNNVRLSAQDLDVRLFKEGSQFMAELVFSGADKHIFRVVMTTGSHNQQVYWLASLTDPRQMILPYLYLVPERRWIPRHSAFVNTMCLVDRPELSVFKADFDRWKTICIKCHATHGQPNPVDEAGRPLPLPRVAEFGISCEACHGPGAAHVRANRDSGATANGVVNPARLPHDRASEVCGQCHSVSFQRTDEAHQKWLQDGYSFRPGEDLFADPMLFISRGRKELMPAERPDLPDLVEFGSYWTDGMARAAGREFNGMIESPCYQKGKLSCLSCHEMHQKDGDKRSRAEWAAGQLKPGMDGNRACVQCHDRFNNPALVTQHTHHLADSTGSKCYNCHMPHTSYGLLKATRSHQVSSPTVAESLQTGRPNACNQCHLDKTLAWTADTLTGWYKQPKPKLTADEEHVAASVLWALRGDAGQRVLMAWSYGWQDALKPSGNTWQAPFLAQLLDDRYDGVRFVAHRSWKRLPGFSDFDYNLVGPPPSRSAAVERARQTWEQLQKTRNRPAVGRQLLIDPEGRILDAEFRRLWNLRDDRPMVINE